MNVTVIGGETKPHAPHPASSRVQQQRAPLDQAGFAQALHRALSRPEEEGEAQGMGGGPMVLHGAPHGAVPIQGSTSTVAAMDDAGKSQARPSASSHVAPDIDAAKPPLSETKDITLRFAANSCLRAMIVHKNPQGALSLCLIGSGPAMRRMMYAVAGLREQLRGKGLDLSEVMIVEQFDAAREPLG